MKNVVSVLVLILSIGNLFANDVKIGNIFTIKIATSFHA